MNKESTPRCQRHAYRRHLLLACLLVECGPPLRSTPQLETSSPLDCSGTSYFVDSEAGDDLYSGMVAETDPGRTDGPFRTIDAAYRRAQPGDCIFVKEGVYRETVTLSKQASESRPIVLQAFPGDEGRAVISGAERIQNWTRCESRSSCGGNPHWQQIFFANVDFEVKQLFQGSSLLVPSRFPDEGWLYPASVSPIDPCVVFVDPTLGKGNGYFTRSTCHIKTKLWHMDHIPVDAYVAEDARITLVSPTQNEISPSFGYYLTNIVGEINEQGEWAYDRLQHRLYLWPLGGCPENVEASLREYGITTNRNCSYHVIRGFSVERTIVGIQLYRANHMTVTGNMIDRSYDSGIMDYRSIDSAIVDNVVRYSNSTGISDDRLSSDDLIEGNHVYATGAEHPGDDLVNGVGEAIVLKGVRARCIHNRVERSSYNGVSVAWGDTAGREIAYNYVTESCLSLSDGAGIYTGNYSNSEEPDHYHHNIVCDVSGYLGGSARYAQPCSQSPALCRGEGHGIYLDERGNNRVFERNTVINCGASGVVFHWVQDSSLIDNVVYGNRLCQILFSGGSNSLTFLRDNDAEGNLLVATAASQSTFRLELGYYDVDIGVSDRNSFYHPQSDRHLAICQYGSTGLVCAPYSLHDWRNLTGQERASTDLSPAVEPTLNLRDPVIFINPSTDVLIIELDSRTYFDFKGNIAQGTVSLDPFESIVLFPSASAIGLVSE